MEILVKGGQIVTMDSNRRVIHGDLLVDGDRIAQVGGLAPAPARGVKRKVVDARDRLVIPGLVQTHVHLCQTLFRGQADDLPLLDWLRRRIWPLEAAHDPDTLLASARLGCAELLQGATTTILDMATVQHTEAVFEAAAESGIRAHIGKAMMDLGDGAPPALLERTEDSLLEAEALADAWHGAEDGRLNYAVAPRFVVSCSEALLKGAAQLADKRGLLVHTHAAENQDEVSLVIERTGLRNISYLDSIGLTNDRLMVAHGIWLDASEMDILERSHTRVLHCPSSNLKLRSGIARVPEMRRRKISVSLGADGAPCNNRLDAFREMNLAVLIQGVASESPLVAMDALEMATIDGARALGLESEIGSLEVGKKADLAILDLGQLRSWPQEGVSPSSILVYSAGASDVTLTIVDGRIVWDRENDTSNPSLMREAAAAIHRIRARAAMT